MIPTSGIAPLGGYARVQAAGVIAPGILLLIEGAAILRHGDHSLLKAAVDSTDGRSSTVLVGGIIAALMAAYVVGRFGRSLAWWLLHSRLFAWAEAPGQVTAIDGEARLAYGAVPVDGVLALHPALSSAVGGGALGEVRAYCKFWLRLWEPRLAIDHIEIEINFLVGSAPALALAPIAVAGLYDWPAFHDLSCAYIGAVVGVVLAVSVLVQARNRMRSELNDAFRNFLVAHWCAETAPARPAPL